MQSMTSFCVAAQRERIGILAVTTTPRAYSVEIERLSDYQYVKVSLGLHPQLISERFEELSMIERLIDKCRFIGEIGLDYSNNFYRSKEKQKRAFEKIVSWCQTTEQKTISIHAVRSAKDVLDILESHDCTRNNACILHWFSDASKQLERAIELGCYFSVNEYMLRSPNGLSIIARIPNDRLLIETDAPFISEIKTATRLRNSLSFCLKELSVNKGNNIVETIARTSAALLL